MHIIKNFNSINEYKMKSYKSIPCVSAKKGNDIIILIFFNDLLKHTKGKHYIFAITIQAYNQSSGVNLVLKFNKRRCSNEFMISRLKLQRRDNTRRGMPN